MTETSTWATKKGLAQMLKGGVIMDVVTPEQAKIAEEAGAVAVMALERVPADIRAAGGVARMSDPSMIEGIMAAVTIPVMAKARIGHFVEAQVLEALGVDYIDESEVLTPADETNHIDKHAFKVPFVCGCRNLGEALRRINEGAAMMRTKGEAGTGNIVEAVRQLRDVLSEIRKLQGMREDELFVAAKDLQAPYELVKDVAANGRLPVVNFVAGGISTPSDAALVMQLGAEGVFVGLRDLQERGSGPDGQRDRPGDDALRGPEDHRRGLEGPGGADARARDGGHPRPGAARRPRLVATAEPAMKIGVLALQGAFAEHVSTLHAIGVEAVEVRLPEDLDDVDGLIIPGGESTTMRRLIDRWGLRQPILDLAETGAPLFGTCAGMIVLAREIAGDEEPVLPLLDVTVERNAFGRQLDSFETELAGPAAGRPAGARGVHPGAGHRAGRARRRRHREARRRPDRGGPRAERHRDGVPPRARGRDALPPAVAMLAAEHADPGEGVGRRPHPTRRAHQGR